MPGVHWDLISRDAAEPATQRIAAADRASEQPDEKDDGSMSNTDVSVEHHEAGRVQLNGPMNLPGALMLVHMPTLRGSTTVCSHDGFDWPCATYVLVNRYLDA